MTYKVHATPCVHARPSQGAKRTASGCVRLGRRGCSVGRAFRREKGGHKPLRAGRSDTFAHYQTPLSQAFCPHPQKWKNHKRASKDGLTISVDTPQRKYQKELPLPEEVDPKPVNASYKNGVLAIRFKKKSKGEKISIQ